MIPQDHKAINRIKAVLAENKRQYQNGVLILRNQDWKP